MKKMSGAVLVFIGLMVAVGGMTLGSSQHYLEPSSDDTELITCGSAWSPRTDDDSFSSERTLTTLGKNNCSWVMAGYGSAATVVVILGLGLLAIGIVGIVTGFAADSRELRQIELLERIEGRLAASGDAPPDLERSESPAVTQERPAVTEEPPTGPVPTVSG